MQEWFAEGKCCDMIIEIQLPDEVSSGPSTRKRKRTEGEKVEIKAHSVVLGARSRHISTCMTRGFEGTGNKKITITLADEQEVEDFRLLIKLSYAPSCVKDGDVSIDRATLIRLASLAEAYEFHHAVNECLTAAGEGLSFEEAITCINDLPENLKGIDASQQLKDSTIRTLMKGLNDPASIADMEEGDAKEEMLKKGADALARQLGPVSGLFNVNEILSKSNKGFSNTLVLKDHVKALSVDAFAKLLQLDTFQLDCEEDAYLLVISWIIQASHDQQAFQKLLSHIRFEHFDPDYLINVVSCCPLMLESELLPKVMAQAFLHRRIPQTVRESYESIPNLSRDRGEGKKREWKIRSNIHLKDCLGMENEGQLHISSGLAMGYPLSLVIRRLTTSEGRDSFGLFCQVTMPLSNDGKNEHGVSLHVSMDIQGVNYSFAKTFDGRGRGYIDLFKKPWKEVVYEGSPHFPQGKMTVDVTVTDPIYWHEKEEQRKKQAEEEKKDN